MEREKRLVIVELQLRGKSFEWAEWAVKKIDFAHYIRKYFVTELAELILANQNKLDLLT